MKRMNLWFAELLFVVLLLYSDQKQPFVCSFQQQFQRHSASHNRERSLDRFFVSKHAFCASAKDDAVTASALPRDASDSSVTSENDRKGGVVHGEQQQPPRLPWTSAVLRISYDGSRFTGWSAANANSDLSLKKRRKRNRRRGSVEEFHDAKLPAGFVRSVEGVMKENFARLYGDVDPNTRIVVEGCSRTDKGVHATCMIAQVYCLKQGFSTKSSSSSSKAGSEGNSESHKDDGTNDGTDTNMSEIIIPGKRIPHPRIPTDDSCFQSLPMNTNLSRMAFAFNRMRPPDVQITAIAPTPEMNDGEVFHASLSSRCKTYEYRISTGYLWDPTLRKVVWHVGSSDLDAQKIRGACALLVGRHDFSAFQGAARGSEDKRKRIEQKQQQNGNENVCTLYDVQINSQHPLNIHEDHYFPGVDPPLQNYTIVVKGDRFLYKMVRFIVGSLVAIGQGKLELEDIERAIETGSWNIPNDPGGRRKQFGCAPPHGLTLTHVDYGDGVTFDWQLLRDPTVKKGQR